MKQGSMPAIVAAMLVTAALLNGCAKGPEALVASAKEYLANDDPTAAAIQLRSVLQKRPEMAEARFLLGKALLETGEVAAAEKELRKAIEFKYPPGEVNPPLARVLLMQGQYRKAVDAFTGAETVSPEGNADLQTTIGLAQMALGQAEAAQAAFSAALATLPAYPPALLGEARLKAQGGDPSAALALIDRALGRSPKLTDGWQLKGDIKLSQGQVDDALEAYRKAVEVKPANVAAHVMIVTLLEARGRLEGANKQLQVLKQIAPNYPQTFYLQALLAYRQKDYATAREAIQKQLSLAPDNLPGLILSSAIAYEAKAYVQAEADLLKVLQTNPNQGFARRLLVRTYLRSGKPAKALETLKPVLHRIDKDSTMLALAGEAYLQNGNAAEAAGYFAKASALDPQSSGNRTGLALAHMAAGDTDRAFRELEDAAAVDTGINSDLALIATSLQRREFGKALAAIDALEKKQSDKPLPYELRGIALLGKQDRAGARKNFERAVALDPTYFPAITSLAALDLADKKPEEAKRRFEVVLAKDPRNVQALLALAELRARAKGSAEEVAALISKARHGSHS